MKSNYGTTGDAIMMRWRDGLFVLDDGKPGAALSLLAARAERKFMELLAVVNDAGQSVSANRSSTFAPIVFERRADADGIKKRAFEQAMDSLMAAGKIKVEPFGPPSRMRTRLIVVEGAIPSDD